MDLVLAHGGRPFAIAVRARPRPEPLVVWQRILPFPAAMWRPLRRSWWRRLANAGAGAVVLTDDLGAELRRLGFRGPIWKIQNFRASTPFADLDRQEAAAALRAEIGVAAEVGVIGLVGHLIEQKRPDRALDVLAGVHARGEHAHLVVAGDGPLRERFDRDAATRGLGACVHLLGERRDVGAVLGGIDLLVSTSAAEGEPGVLIEALMAGCPVVAMRVGGVATVVEDGVTGILVDAGDVTAMSERVVELLAMPFRRSGSGRRQVGAGPTTSPPPATPGPARQDSRACSAAPSRAPDFILPSRTEPGPGESSDRRGNRAQPIDGPAKSFLEVDAAPEPEIARGARGVGAAVAHVAGASVHERRSGLDAEDPTEDLQQVEERVRLAAGDVVDVPRCWLRTDRQRRRARFAATTSEM